MGIEKRISQIERAADRQDLPPLEIDLKLLSDSELDELHQLHLKLDAGVELTAEDVAAVARMSERCKSG
jgi:hypothetical protein